MFKTELITGIVMSFIVALLLIESPIIMKKILLHISKQDATSEQTKAIKGVIKMYVIVFIVKIFFNQLTERKFFMIGLRVQLLITNLFMRKISRLSLNDLTQSKAQVMNYLIIEIKKIETFFKKGSWLFSQPPVLILVIIILLFKNLWLGFLMLEIIFGFIVIKILTENHMENSHHHKVEIQQKRIYHNVQFFKQIKQMKTIGYGDLLTNKQLEYLKEENKYNMKYMTAKHIIESFLILIPFVFYLVYFVQRLRTQSLDGLNLVDTYILLIYTQILITPLKNIRYISSYLENLTKALSQLETFFNIPQVERLIYTNRDLLLASIKFSNIKIDRDNLVSQSIEKSDAQYFLLEKNNPITSPGRKVKNHIKIPFMIELNAGDHLVVLGEKDEGSVLLSLLAGNIDLEEGRIQYNGKIAYVSSELWLVEGTIRDNVLMGQNQNQQRLKLVYHITDLSTDFATHLPNTDTTLISSFSLTESHKRRISLARALYVDADIYLLDSIFQGVNKKIVEKVYFRLSEHLKDRTMIVAAKRLELLSKDKVLLFVNRPKVVEYGNVQKLTKGENQNFRSFMEKKGEESQEESITIEQSQAQLSSSTLRPTRQAPIPLSTFSQFFSYGSLRICLLSFSLLILIQLFKLYLDILLSHIHNSNNTKTEYQSVTHYITLLVVLIGLHVLVSTIELTTSKRLSKRIVGDLTRSMVGNLRVEELEGQHQMGLIEIVSKDYQELFVLIHRFPALISYAMTLILTLSLLLYLSPRLFPSIFILLLSNLLIFHYLIRTQREITRHKPSLLSHMYSSVYSFISGVQTIKHYSDPESFLLQKLQPVTDYAIYLQNERFNWHAVKMVGEVTTLLVTYWTVMFAVGKRKWGERELVLLFVVVSYCLKLGGLVCYAVEEWLEIENGIRKTVGKMLSIINDTQEQKISEIKMNPSNLMAFDLLKIQTSSIDLFLFSNTRLALYGPRSKLSSLFYLLTRTTIPFCKGQITLNDIDILSIPLSIIHKQIFHFTTNPFVFTGTVYENVDPFGRYKPSEVFTAIRESGLMQVFGQSNEGKAGERRLVYEKVGLGARVGVNLARMILKQPEVLLVELGQSGVWGRAGLKKLGEIIGKATAVLSNPDEVMKRFTDSDQSL